MLIFPTGLNKSLLPPSAPSCLWSWSCLSIAQRSCLGTIWRKARFWGFASSSSLLCCYICHDSLFFSTLCKPESILLNFSWSGRPWSWRRLCKSFWGCFLYFFFCTGDLVSQSFGRGKLFCFDDVWFCVCWNLSRSSSCWNRGLRRWRIWPVEYGRGL